MQRRHVGAAEGVEMARELEGQREVIRELKSRLGRMGAQGGQNDVQLKRLANENYRLLADLQEKDVVIERLEDRTRTLDAEVHGFQELRSE